MATYLALNWSIRGFDAPKSISFTVNLSVTKQTLGVFKSRWTIFGLKPKKLVYMDWI